VICIADFFFVGFRFTKYYIFTFWTGIAATAFPSIVTSAFLYFLIFSIFMAKLIYMIARAQRFDPGPLHSKFYFCLIISIGLFWILNSLSSYWIIPWIIVLSSFWLPQIWENAIRGGRGGGGTMEWIIGNTFIRLLYPLYFFGYVMVF